MNTRRYITLLVLCLPLAAIPVPARAEESFAQTCDKVNPKLVKLFGAGGFRGSGILRQRHSRFAGRLHPDRQ